ncbi:MAG: SprT-like domain-containing protein [Thiohalomonadales bacterium]
MKIEPILKVQQQEVIEVTMSFIQRACRYYDRQFVEIPVLFDLTGRASGMYCIKARKKYIRFNPWLFAKYYDDSLSDTIPHEVAHYISDELYGLRNIRPHGAEWKSVMLLFGVKAKATGNYDLSGIPTRQHKRIDYHCACDTYQFTTKRHNQVLRGTASYACRKCGEMLVIAHLT